MADGSVKIKIDAEDSGVEKKLDDVGESAKDAAGGLDDLGKKGEEAGKGLDVADVAAGNLVSNGLQSLISGLGDAVASLFELAESTREFREDMAKLETAFTTTGHSSETAKNSYNDFYAILGESDRAVEAVNHLAELTKNEKELADWSTIAAGVTAKFGDSLPIEGLTEAANETAKVGKVTGPLADALVWAGISEEKFNEQLETCNSEQERASLITSTLTKEYQAAADEYNELTASTQDARRATADLEQTQAELGEAIEPLTTAWTNLKTQALQAILPVVQSVANAFQDVQEWMDNNPQAAEAVRAAIVGLATAFGVLAAAMAITSTINALKAALTALGAAAAMNPYVLIAAAIAGLIAGFVYLLTSCEEFKQFWVDFGEGVAKVFSDLGSAISSTFSDAWTATTEAWNHAEAFFHDLWQDITEVFKDVGTFFSDTFTSAKNGVEKAWDKTGEFFSGVWTGVQNAFKDVGSFFSGAFSSARTGVESAWNSIGNFFSGLWGDIQSAFSNISSFFSSTFSDAWAAATSAFTNVGNFFSGVVDDIVDAFVNIGREFMEIGAEIVNGIYEGITAGWQWLTDTVKNLANSLFGAAKEELEINSPSKKFYYLGDMSGAGYGEGWTDSMGDVEKDLKNDLAGMTARVQATVSAENARYGTSPGVADTGFVDLARAVGSQTAGINSLASEYRRGAASGQPVVIELDRRELGRAVVDVGNAENTRKGSSLAYGG